MPAYFGPMKIHPEKRAVTFGDLIESGYRACGARRATDIIRLAAQARHIYCVGAADQLRHAAEAAAQPCVPAWGKHPTVNAVLPRPVAQVMMAVP
jgi:hypothetical protein